MPTFPDHPLVVARTRAGLTQTELARRAGVSRLTVAKIENAVTRKLEPSTNRSLAAALNGASTLQPQIDAWFSRLDPRHHLGPAQRSMLHLTPEGVTERFASFRDWRSAIAPSTEFFAALTGVHRATVDDYEKGIRVNGMSSTLAVGLLRLGITDDYLLALRRLDPAPLGSTPPPLRSGTVPPTER